MADLSYVQATQEVKVIGQDASGNNLNAVGADTNGNLLVKDYADGATGSAVPTVTTQVGGSDGTNLRTFKTDISGRLSITLNDASGSAITLGQALMATSIPVVLASNHSAINVQGNVASGATDTGNPEKIGGVFNTTLPTVVSGQRVDAQMDSNGRLIVVSVPVDGAKATYSAAATGILSGALAQDIFTITGSATKTIRILRITITATQTTSSQINILLVKRSTANTAGTSAAVVAVPMNSTSPAASATVLTYTANPTAGTLVGAIRTRKVFIGSTTANSDEMISDFGVRTGQAVVLNGTSQVFAVNLNGTTVTAGSFNISVEWTEE